MSFWSELKRRNVVKVAIAYLIVAWLIIQIVSIIFPMFHMPEWTGIFVTVLLIIGFPIVLIFAWAFEITPEGLKRTHEVPHHESITHLTGQKLNYIVIGLFVIAVAYILFDNLYLDRRFIETEVASRVAELAPTSVEQKEAPKTIAVLPFVNLSSDPEQDFFVDGLSEELLNSLTKIPDLQVIARTSSFAFKGTDKKVQEIADELGANYILEGSVRKARNELRITAQLIRAEDGIHLWSEIYDRRLEDIFAIQEDIATSIANELKLKLGIGKSFKQLGGTDSVEAYELYLVSKGQMWNWISLTDLKQALESIDGAIALDSEFALAWALKANIHVFYSIRGPSINSDSEKDEAMYAAQRAIELEPNLATGYMAMGYIQMSRADWIAAELAFRSALELTSEYISIDGMFYTALHYTAVGNFKRAHELLIALRRSDPLDMITRAQYMMSFALLSETKRAEEEDKRAREFFQEKWDSQHYVLPICLGIHDAVSPGEIQYSNRIFESAKRHLDSPEEGFSELRQFYDDNENMSSLDLIYISLWSAYFGDPEFAVEALTKALEIESSGTFWIWFPVFQEVRQLPRFKELVRKIGLVDYWNQFGWPDICQPTDNGDFVCDWFEPGTGSEL